MTGTVRVGVVVLCGRSHFQCSFCRNFCVNASTFFRCFICPLVGLHVSRYHWVAFKYDQAMVLIALLFYFFSLSFSIVNEDSSIIAQLFKSISLIQQYSCWYWKLVAMQGCVCVGISIWLERTQTGIPGNCSFHVFLRFVKASSSHKEAKISWRVSDPDIICLVDSSLNLFGFLFFSSVWFFFFG